jgi:hypothetical protein
MCCVVLLITMSMLNVSHFLATTSEVSWKERAQFAEDIASLAALLRDKVASAQPVIDANHVLVHKQKKKAQLAGWLSSIPPCRMHSSIRSFATSCADTGLRCANVAKGDDNELGADFGLLLVGSFNPPRLLHNPRVRSNSCAVVRAVSQS